MLIQLLPMGFEPSASRPVTIPTRPLNLGLLGKGTSSILMSSVVDREAINTQLWLMETHQKIKNNNVALVSSVSLAFSSFKVRKTPPLLQILSILIKCLFSLSKKSIKKIPFDISIPLHAYDMFEQ